MTSLSLTDARQQFLLTDAAAAKVKSLIEAEDVFVLELQVALRPRTCDGSTDVWFFDLAAADHEVFDGKTINLATIVREQVLLALPMSVVCKEDCRGLCPICGQDQNQSACDCERHVPDPRFAALKNIKLS